jgi:exonuclease SbcC
LVEEALRREEELRQRRTAEKRAQEQVIRAQQALSALEYARQRKAELEQRQLELGVEKGIYEDLRGAFGKNGVPAMIIEAAIPELEEAANRLLARMTDGRMHVRLDTQRDLRTGGVSETLDILISDELGTRSYESYSGGEAFRVNFAIRVALSQMLARRAGAQLRTLFIDEGFGTQDEIGRQRLVEAINAVQDHFDLVLVITHIDELRDAFPVQIGITKTPNGSRVMVG